MSDSLDGTIKLLKDVEDGIQKLNKLPKTIVKDSIRVAPASDKIKERGSLKDRLAQTDEEAMNNYRVEMAQRHQATTENEMTEEEHEEIVDEMVDKIVSNIVNNIFG